MPDRPSEQASTAGLPRSDGRGARVALVAIGLMWVGLVGVGLSVLWSHENAPGVAGPGPARWPSRTRVPAPHDRPALVMLVHPQCVCSRASIAELDRLMATVQGLVDSYVLFLAPVGLSEDWVKSDLWRSAAAIPGVRVVRDEDGTEAGQFGAATSGHTLLFDRDGVRRFSGGITGSRGHEGDNAGRRALVSLLTEGHARTASTSVFGCALFGSADERPFPEGHPHATDND